MRFVRVTVSHSQNRVVAVMEQDVPFREGGRCLIDGEDCETLDLGVVDEDTWFAEDGRPVRLTEHLLAHLESGDAGVRRVYDVPCTIEGMRQRLRERGPRGIPVTIRAWLATILPPDEAAAMGIARGLPISALKACEASRVRRDPQSGSRLAYFERLTHEMATRRSERALRKRRLAEDRRQAKAAAADEAFNEMRAAIERAGAGDGDTQVR